MTAASLTSLLIENAQAWEESKGEAEKQRLIAVANKLIEELENPAEKLARIGWGEPSRTAALRTAFELGLFERLADEPKESKALAQETGADPLLVGKSGAQVRSQPPVNMLQDVYSSISQPTPS